MTAFLPKSSLNLHQPLAPRRALFGSVMTVLAVALTITALVPIFAITFELLRRGIDHLNWEVLTSLPAPVGLEEEANGFGNAILGTLLMVLIAAILSVPLGVATGIFLSEFQRESKLGQFVRLVITVLSSVPSIITGVFAFSILVYTLKQFSALAGGVALGVIMLPVIALTTDEALKLVPDHNRLASASLGSDRFQTIFRVVIPEALPAIVTGVLLAVARAAGETAPLIFTALSSQFWPPFFYQLGEIFQDLGGPDTGSYITTLPETLLSPTPSMAVLIYTYAESPYAVQNNLAWAAAFVLLGSILFINIVSRLLVMKRH
jgi:phosphate transport system permease protein